VITNTGKSIIGKYLLGQAPAYASYIAVGCGQKPLLISDPSEDHSLKQNLDFEMFRVPISSRGFINENGTEKIVLTAEIPTEERYEITEVGIYSAGANSAAGAYDSKTVFAFTQTENWQYHTTSEATAIPTISESLDAPDNDNIVATTNKVFQTNADNTIFYKTSRAERYERPRFFNNVIMMRGDDADLTISSESGPGQDHFVIEDGSNHIHLTGPNVDFSKNSPIDELRLAFSIVNKDGASEVIQNASSPDAVRILVDFASTDSANPEAFARFEAELINGTGTGEYDFDSNRYFVISKQLQNLYISPNFTWDAVTVVKIYTTAIVGTTPSDDYYIALDALRLENVATANPLYGLTGYSVIKNSTSSSIVKSPNTSNYIEFRFSIGVS
jgi:hypothetical protein